MSSVSILGGSATNYTYDVWDALKCDMPKKLTIEFMQFMAESREGNFLSETYSGVSEKHRWRCQSGHEWAARPADIRKGSWCPNCAAGLSERICRAYFEGIFLRPFPKARPEWLRNSRGNRMELDGYNRELKLAFEYHGVQHFREAHWMGMDELGLRTRRFDDNRKVTLCKKNGINLVAIPFGIDRAELGNYILEKCRVLGVSIRPNLNLKKINIESAYSPKLLQGMQALAAERGGRCLAKNYIDAYEKLTWVCAQGHEWLASPNDVKNNLSWCPECALNKKNTLIEAQTLASEAGGRCISSSYRSAHAKLKWECKHGHTWQAPFNRVSKGHWCPKCAGNMQRSTHDMEVIAKERGGKFMSKGFSGVMTKYQWQCNKGHQWAALASNIIKGSWCPDCAGVRRKSITAMQRIAEANYGKCLSDEYVNNRTSLEWQCKAGHTWSAKPTHISRGSWCPYCARTKK